MAISFKHYYKSGSLIGTGAVKFRPYTVASPLPQLATPQNVTADGTVVSWDEVENATSYEVIEGGNNVLGTVTNGYTVSGFYRTRGSDTCFYSLDNGSTWISFRTLTFDSSDHFTIPNVKTIKFKAEDDGNYYGSISSTQLNFNLYSGYNDVAKYSENFTLTQNITDVEVNSGAD